MARKRYKQAPPDRPRIAPSYGWVHIKLGAYRILERLTTPPYPIRPADQLQVGATVTVLMSDTAYHFTEGTEFGGDLISGTLGATYFPIDFSYRLPGGGLSEDLEVSGDLIAGTLGATYFPLDYTYRRGDAVPSEDMQIDGDLIAGTLESNYLPIDYLNWPPEGVTVTGDLISGTKV